jgi:hypothetical protein
MSMRARLVLVGLLGLFAGGCESVLGLGGLTGAAGATASSGETTSTSGSGGCTDASACPEVPPGPCASLGTRTCTGGVCGVSYKAGRAPSQEYGSCHLNECDATGAMTSVVDDTNVFDSGNACVPHVCSMGVLAQAIEQGAPCALPSGAQGACEPDADPTRVGDFVCAVCGSPATSACPSALPICVSGRCVGPHCANGTKDSGETSVDCGGSQCLPCGATKVCLIGSDCFSHVCTSGICQAPSCSDGVENGTETDVDCGGACPPCSDLKKCAAPGDCESGVCRPTGSNVPDRCQAPTCTDGVKNGGETGVDCGGDGDGGPACPPCAG